MVWDFFVGYIFGKRSGSVIRRIAWISVVAVVLGVGALVLVMSIMRALNVRIEERTLAVDPHLVVSVPEARQLADLETSPALQKARAHELWSVFYVDSQDVIIRTVEGRFRGGVARGMSAEGLAYLLREIDRVKNRASDPIDAELAPGEVMIGIDLAHSLGVFEGDSLLIVPPEGLLLPIGERPPLERVRVKRIIATNIADVDSQVVFFDYAHTMRALRKGVSRKLEAHIWTESPLRAEEHRDEIVNVGGVQALTWKERNSALFHALKLERAVIGLFLTLASLVAGFSLLSVLGLLISQKKMDIGILQAMGYSSRQVAQLFLKIGMCLAGIGIGTGVLIGSALSLYLQYYPLELFSSDIYYDSEIPAQLELSFVVTVLIAGGALAYFGMRMGTKAILQLTPTQCLRH